MLIRAATVLCNSCSSFAELVLCFIACFILLVIAPLNGDARGLYTAFGVATDGLVMKYRKAWPTKLEIGMADRP